MPLNILLQREEGVEVEGATNGDLYTSPSGSLLTEQYVDIPFPITPHSPAIVKVYKMICWPLLKVQNI